jgi:hypothetical protein
VGPDLRILARITAKLSRGQVLMQPRSRPLSSAKITGCLLNHRRGASSLFTP